MNRTNHDINVENHEKSSLLKKIRYFTKYNKNNVKGKIYNIYESGAWRFLIKKSSNPYFTTSGKLKIAENELPVSVYRKVHNLYRSILDARSVLLRYKSDIATIVAMENDCITPLVASKRLPMVFYKREDYTSIKAYKIRGAIYQMSKIIEKNHSKKLRFVAASTGNHALGVLKSAEVLKVPRVTICISETVTGFKKNKLEKRVNELKAKGINAELVVEGHTFDQTNEYAINLVKTNPDTYYIDPYNSHNAVAGQGTIGLELLSQFENNFFNLDSLDFEVEKLKNLKEIVVIVPIGGGGLISGISTGFKLGIQNHPRLKHLKVEIIGVKLKDLNSKYGDAIKVKKIGCNNFDFINYLVDKQILVNDMDMQRGANFVLDDIGARVETASSSTLTPILDNMLVPSSERAVILIISGGNITLPH